MNPADLNSTQSSEPVTVAPTAPQPQNPINVAKKNNTPLVFGLLGIIILGLIGTVVYLLNKNPASNSSAVVENVEKMSAPTSMTEATQTTEQPTSLDPSYILKETNCYTVAIPNDSVVGDDNNCAQHISTDSLVLDIDIIPAYREYTSATQMAKAESAEAKLKIKSEQETTVGGMPAYRIIVDLSNGNYTLDGVRYYVYIPNKYTVSAVPISGFVITSASYNEADRKTAFEKALASLSWK